MFLNITTKKKKNIIDDTSARDPRKRTQRTQPEATWQRTTSIFLKQNFKLDFLANANLTKFTVYFLPPSHDVKTNHFSFTLAHECTYP